MFQKYSTIITSHDILLYHPVSLHLLKLIPYSIIFQHIYIPYFYLNMSSLDTNFPPSSSSPSPVSLLLTSLLDEINDKCALSPIKSLVDNILSLGEEGRHALVKTISTLVSHASQKGKLPVFQYLTEDTCFHFSPASSFPYIFYPALERAAENGHLPIIKHIIETLHFKIASDNTSVLFLAAVKGHLEVVKYLIKGEYVNVHANDDEVLRLTALYGPLGIVKYLVEEGHANIKARRGEAVQWAVEKGRLDLVKYFIKALQDSSREVELDDGDDGDDNNNGHQEKKNKKDTLEANESYQSFVDTQKGYWLRLGAIYGRLNVIKYLIEKIGAGEGEGKAVALCVAAEHGHLDVVKYLIEGKDVNNTRSKIDGGHSGHSGHSGNVEYEALYMAASEGRIKIVEYLIERRIQGPVEDKTELKEVVRKALKQLHKKGSHQDMIKYLQGIMDTL